MDVLTSTEFRKRYATLIRDTRVTVNGHVVGTWSPAGAYMTIAEIKATLLEDVHAVMAEAGPTPGFNSRPFTPVPKKGK